MKSFRSKESRHGKKRKLDTTNTCKLDTTNTFTVLKWDLNVQCNFGSLVSDILVQILSYLDIPNQFNGATVNRHWRVVFRSSLVRLNVNGDALGRRFKDTNLFECVSAFGSLQSLSLAGCKWISSNGLAYLITLTNLNSLDLSDCDQFTLIGFKSIVQLTKLHTLSLDHAFKRTTNGYGIASAPISLRAQTLGHFLPHFTNLTYLSLRDWDFKDSYHRSCLGFEALQQLTNLTSLNLSNWGVGTGEKDLPLLTTLTNLVSLELNHCNIKGRMLHCLTSLKKLRFLDITELTHHVSVFLSSYERIQ